MNCKHFGKCGGCTYLDMPYEEELALKERDLRETLGEYGHLLKGLEPSPCPTGYRNKMELAFGDECKDGKLALGIRKRRSYYEVATPRECVLIPDDMSTIIQYVQQYFREAGEAFFHRKRHTGSLRHLVLRHGAFTGEILMNLSTSSALKTPLEPLVAGLLALPLSGRIVGILHSVNDGLADAVKNENMHVLWGQDFYFERLSGLKFKVSAFSFFQTNTAGAEVLYKIVRDYAQGQPGHRALDLYCGTGTIAQVVSPDFESVTGIELDSSAIAAAKENAGLNNIANCDFHAGDVSEVLDGFQTGGGGSPFDVVIADPPRDGLHPKALAQIGKLSAPKLIYVACKPKSLARDIPLLAEAGYVPTQISGVDLFPRTPHVEAIALLRQHGR